VNLSQCLAYYGLRATATPTGTNVTNDVQIGLSNTPVALTGANVAYSVRGIFAGSDDVLSLDLTTGSTTGSTAWVAGTAQIETATAAGTITGTGNASVVVTAADMTGSPKTISVAVANSDTAATWAGKVRTALAADASVSELFTVGGTTTAISLTRKPTATYTVGSETVNIYPANDGTLNISLDNGTCTGITTAGTSANTQSGTATDGVKIYDGDQKDYEGVTIPTINTIKAALFQIPSDSGGSVTAAGVTDDVFAIGYRNTVLFTGDASEEVDLDDSYTFTSNSASGANFTVTVFGTAS
jgi:hypothetical protein